MPAITRTWYAPREKPMHIVLENINNINLRAVITEQINLITWSKVVAQEFVANLCTFWEFTSMLYQETLLSTLSQAYKVFLLTMRLPCLLH
jgi:hypothetical protein